MIVYWPGKTTGMESASLISTVDVLPTVLDIAGIPIPEKLKLDGHSFLPVIADPSRSTRAHIFAENGYTRAISDGKYKFIALRYPQSLIHAMQENEIEHAPSYVGSWPQAHSAIAMKCFPHYFDQNQLYDLEIDHYEQDNIDSAHAQVSHMLQKALKEHLSSFAHPFDLEKNAYLSSSDYRSHYQVNLEYDLANIPWLRRDHDAFEWPPK